MDPDDAFSGIPYVSLDDYEGARDIQSVEASHYGITVKSGVHIEGQWIVGMESLTH